MTGRSAPPDSRGGPPSPRRRRRVSPCQVLTGLHSLTRARLYPCGWLCDLHSPWHVAGRPATHTPQKWTSRV